jgi:hypothetical protein
MSIKRLTISISQVAPLVGIDEYNNFPRIICEIWRKYNPEEFKIIETKLKGEKHQISTASDYNDIWEIDNEFGTNYLDQVKAINSNSDKSSNEMVQKQVEIIKQISDSKELNDMQKSNLSKKICSATNKSHGITNESSILTEFCRLSEKTIVNTDQWVKQIFIENLESSDTNATNATNDSKIEWCIIGKYDAITSDNELVEAKMRQNVLFKKVRNYENVQVQLYLHALEFEKAYLVESYKNKKNIMTMFVNEINYDSDYVNDVILDRLKKFINFFEIFINNTEYKEALLKGDKDRKIYQIYEESFLSF